MESLEDINLLNRKLRTLGGDLNRTLVNLRVDGVPSLADMQQFEKYIVEEAAAVFHHLRIDRKQLHPEPTDDDLDSSRRRAEGVEPRHWEQTPAHGPAPSTVSPPLPSVKGVDGQRKCPPKWPAKMSLELLAMVLGHSVLTVGRFIGGLSACMYFFAVSRWMASSRATLRIDRPLRFAFCTAFHLAV